IQAFENSVEIYSPTQGWYPIGSDLCIKWSFIGYDGNRAIRGEPRTTPTAKNYPVETPRRMFKTAATSLSAMPVATAYTTTLLIMVVSWQNPSRGYLLVRFLDIFKG
ncbi:6054_t:CDS:2, partial [Dentiscutata heterogama]